MKATIISAMMKNRLMEYENVVSVKTKSIAGILHYAIELEDGKIELFQWSEFYIAIDDLIAANEDNKIRSKFYEKALRLFDFQISKVEETACAFYAAGNKMPLLSDDELIHAHNLNINNEKLKVEWMFGFNPSFIDLLVTEKHHRNIILNALYYTQLRKKTYENYDTCERESRINLFIEAWLMGYDAR